MRTTFLCALAFFGTTALAADPPPRLTPERCKTDLPWLLPVVEPGFDVSEQYLLTGATTPTKVIVCHCTEKTGKVTPHVWVNVTKPVAAEKKDEKPAGGGKLLATSEAPAVADLDKAWKAAKGRSQFELVTPSGNTVVVTRLSAPACMTAVGLSVLVMHSSKDEERWGTSSEK